VTDPSLDGFAGVAVAWADIAAVGPFFVVRTHRPSTPLPARWRPMSELIDTPDVLAARVDRVRAALAATAGRPTAQIEVRVAASVAHLGLTARVISPLLACTLTFGAVPAITLDDLCWQDELGGAFPLSVSTANGFVPGSTTDLATVFREQILDGPIAALTNAVQVVRPVSHHILWGNVASAVVAAAARLSVHRPALAGDVGALTEALFGQPPLSGTGSLGPPFRRRSCCLIYRIASTTPTAVCGDCAFIEQN
jgi:hypothetical protein